MIPAVNEIYQTSTMGALLAGIYDGDVTAAELLRHGDTGVGTFNRLDGEMVILDGRCYRLRADGSARLAAAEDQTPFAVITRFAPETMESVAGLTRDALLAGASRRSPSPNLFYAIRLDGLFAQVTTRTISAQRRPYPPLREVTAGQSERSLVNVRGSVVGFRTPDYEQGISVAGYHLHFIDDERSRGGHVIDFALAHGDLATSSISEIYLSLPRSGPFLSAPLADGADASAQITATEN